ncbi:stage V sporulation protein SpoVAA [Barrientosiimonas marina]|uniref:Stage V sporulation protein AA n=1 Tax=Lentibacillus kimchii TaxID=1542911 RepID=A0ABW2UW99_9BACI
MSEVVYLRMKKNISITSLGQITLKEIAHISASEPLQQELESTPIYRVTKKDRNVVIVDSFLIIDHLNKTRSDLEFQLVGPTHTLIRVQKQFKKPSILVVAFVWLILFIGAAMTIMNFHYDVSMQEVQQKLHYLLTGEVNAYPLWMQIPYSLGIGAGMLLFFNHWFQKRFNEEPSPLEVEIFNYQQEMDQYLSHYENKLNDN